jgi:hypothetical protein
MPEADESADRPLTGRAQKIGLEMDIGGGDFITTHRLLVAIVCVLFPLILFVLGILGGYYIYGEERMWAFSTANFNVVFSVPMAIIASLAVVIILVTATPRDKFSIKVLSGFELTGPSVPIILWIGCFLAIIFGVYVMSGNIRKDDGSMPNQFPTSSPVDSKNR